MMSYIPPPMFQYNALRIPYLNLSDVDGRPNRPYHMSDIMVIGDHCGSLGHPIGFMDV